MAEQPEGAFVPKPTGQVSHPSPDFRVLNGLSVQAGLCMVFTVLFL